MRSMMSFVGVSTWCLIPIFFPTNTEHFISVYTNMYKSWLKIEFISLFYPYIIFPCDIISITPLLSISLAILHASLTCSILGGIFPKNRVEAKGTLGYVHMVVTPLLPLCLVFSYVILPNPPSTVSLILTPPSPPNPPTSNLQNPVPTSPTTSCGPAIPTSTPDPGKYLE